MVSLKLRRNKIHMQDGNCVPKKVTKICNENILTIDNLVIMIEEFQILGYIFKSCV